MIKKFLFVITIFIFSIGLCYFNNTMPDLDLWARLIAGEYIVENLAVPKHDFWSYTPTHPWYDHEWGASVIFYLVLKIFGSNGLIIFKGILTALTLLFCYKTVEIRKPTSSIPYNIFYYAFMLWIVSISLGPVVRCLLFTCLFFSIFIYILERYRIKGGKCLILLPFLMVLWSNIHGGCISGLGLIAIYIIGEFLNGKSIKPYILTLSGCIIALFINPYGFEYVRFLFYAGLMKRQYIFEWASPFALVNLKGYIRYKVYLAILLIIQITYIIKNKINFKSLDKTKLLVILAMIYLSVTSSRHITFFVFTAGTLLYEEFYFLLNQIKFQNKDINDSLCLFKDICIYVFLLIISLPVILSSKNQVIITNSEYPGFAVEFVKINNIKGNLFINFDWGSYAAYKLYPHNLVVMDGRYEEVYNPDLLIQLKNFHLVQNDWYKIIRDYKTDVMIIEKKYRVYEAISIHPDWVKVFENNLSAVFVPRKNLKDKYLLPVPYAEYYNANVFKTDINKTVLKNIHSQIK